MVNTLTPMTPPQHPFIESDSVEGTVVYSPAGERIGTIKRLIIDKVSGQVTYAVTVFGGFLGLGAESHTIPWNRLWYDTGQHGYRTDITEQEIRSAPEFSREDILGMPGHARDALSDHYKLPLVE
jgi:PRC-barrel domain protein